jgi:hypothetical protein
VLGIRTCGIVAADLAWLLRLGLACAAGLDRAYGLGVAVRHDASAGLGCSLRCALLVLLGAGADLGNVLLLCCVELLELGRLARLHGAHCLCPRRIERLQIGLKPCLELGDARLMRGANTLLRGSQPIMRGADSQSHTC